jgi:hypothetical protein
MIFSKPIEEVIGIRHSVRSYNDKNVSTEILETAFDFIKKIDNPFQGDVSIYLVKKEDLPGDVKLGTYGMIKGGKYFLIGVSGDENKDKIALGYMLEKAVLYLTDQGLGTVWLGGTFNRSEFEKTVSILGHQKVRIVIPFGYEGEKKSILGMLAGNNRKKRKSFEEIFYEGEKIKSLSEEDAAEFRLPLEMMRQAPSGVNKQPWAAIKKGNEIDFYMTDKTNLSLIDMGIAISHFAITCEEKNIPGKLEEKDNKGKNSLGEYITTWS